MKKSAVIMYVFAFLLAAGGAFVSKATEKAAKPLITVWRADCGESAQADCVTTQNNNGACTHVFQPGTQTAYAKTTSTPVDCNIPLYKRLP